MINTTKSNTTLYLQEKDMTQIIWPLQITLLDCTMILLTLQVKSQNFLDLVLI